MEILKKQQRCDELLANPVEVLRLSTPLFLR
jgi:hypothetical protein